MYHSLPLAWLCEFPHHRVVDLLGIDVIVYWFSSVTNSFLYAIHEDIGASFQVIGVKFIVRDRDDRGMGYEISITKQYPVAKGLSHFVGRAHPCKELSLK